MFILKCLYVDEFAELCEEEILYWTKKLKTDKTIALKDEIGIRTRVYDIFNAYLGLTMSPQGMCSLLKGEARHPDERSALELVTSRIGKKYVELAKGYKETMYS